MPSPPSKPPGLQARSDLARLRRATRRRRVTLTRSLYGPESATRHINRETVLLLGGGRALLLQVAHPLVAAGVAAHSKFREDPLQRLWRTLELTLTITFGDVRRAIAAVRAIERRHARVHGRLSAAVGPFPRGTRYDANDPALLFWVHATLLDTALLVYDRFIEPVPEATQVRYYEESKIGARLFGIADRLIPPTYADFQAYMMDMITGETLTVGEDARSIAASILSPPVPLGVRQALQTANFFTVGLLPPAIRERYGFSWGRLREDALDGLAKTAQYVLPVLPDFLRAWPQARLKTTEETASLS